ncbi:hypothetical protein [Gibbsiella dentisursi]
MLTAGVGFALRYFTLSFQRRGQAWHSGGRCAGENRSGARHRYAKWPWG